MIERSLVVVNTLGLHARAAAQLVRLAGSFRSKILVIRPDRDQTANAKSILSVLTLAAAKGTELIVQAEGEDENDAMDAVLKLFADGFGESM